MNYYMSGIVLTVKSLLSTTNPIKYCNFLNNFHRLVDDVSAYARSVYPALSQV